MTTLKELIAQREEIEKQIAEVRKNEVADAIKKVRSLIGEYQLTQQDVFGGAVGAKKVKVAGTKVAAKYRDSVTGKEWSGRGLAPKWLQGKNKTDYLIAN